MQRVFMSVNMLVGAVVATLPRHAQDALGVPRSLRGAHEVELTSMAVSTTMAALVIAGILYRTTHRSAPLKS